MHIIYVGEFWNPRYWLFTLVQQSTKWNHISRNLCNAKNDFEPCMIPKPAHHSKNICCKYLEVKLLISVLGGGGALAKF